MSVPPVYDRTGQHIKVGDCVTWNEKHYTVTAASPVHLVLRGVTGPIEPDQVERWCRSCSANDCPQDRCRRRAPNGDVGIMKSC